MNSRDIEAMIENFTTDYRSEQPLQPDREFTGRAGIQQTWRSRFDEFDEFHAEVRQCIVEGNCAWVEWHWRGIQSEDITFEAKGVTILEVDDGQIRRGRIYMASPD
jgi:ketosteroid isomerase-like protein